MDIMDSFEKKLEEIRLKRIEIDKKYEVINGQLKLIGDFMEFDDPYDFDPYIDESWVNMGRPLLYGRSWDWLIPVGKKMEKMVIDGNWGEFEQFFSDEIHALDSFKQACSEFDIESTFKAALIFIETLPNQDQELVKKAKEYGN